jgi:hypothetical protein
MGFVLARTTDDPARDTYTSTLGMGSSDLTLINQMRLPETIPNNATTTIALAKTAIDNLIARKAVGTFVNHGANASSGVELSTPYAIDQIANYIAQKVQQGVLRVPLGSQFYAGLA